MTDPSDGCIIADVLSGHSERFAVLVRRYERALMRVAKSRLGRTDWAEDVTQETFLCAFKSLASYDSRYSFRTWLWTILLNQCRRTYQKSQRQPRVDAWTDESVNVDGQCETWLQSDDVTPVAKLLTRERTERLEQLLSALPEEQGDALRLRFYGGLKFHEIADAMACSLSTAKNRVKWGLMKISAQLCPENLHDEL